ncbi:endonuclease domain-containing protein [Bradyrhizobium sp.]|uniref:endonuclease domain-containing protein n=1 Tax=Bradyrhizobium sp. TaxID=376 RepID=UPI002D62662B|nr:endonuclease domain-containing protein [Bradyrhizobium sp.]HZR77215.1 endonuclease domain-containing protein [Bradyrhizobium sp.]
MISTSIRRSAARKLRANTTPHERLLWRALKELPRSGTHFRRQAPLGPYIVDFLCPAKRLVIEVDGGHHSDGETARHDRARQRWLEKEGYRVLRFWNSEIARDLKAVLEQIYVKMHGSREADITLAKHRRRLRSSPHPAAPRRPSPSRGG